MDDLTPLDEAHAIMVADEDDEAARLGFFARLAAAEVFILLEGPAEGDQIEPQLAGHEGARYVLTFDSEDRLTTFTGDSAPFAAMSGRVLAGMLYGQDIGIALNPDVAPSSILLPADAVEWLAEILDQDAEEGEAQIKSVHPPRDVPDQVLVSIDRRLASMAGRAQRAYLVRADYADGSDGLLLAVVGAVDGAEGAIAQAVREVAAFSATPLNLDVGFFAATDMALVAMSDVGLQFDLPEPEEITTLTPTAPGMDPDKPPRLH